MAIGVYTRYDKMTTRQRETFDWFSDEVESEIAVMAMRYCVRPEEIHRRLETYIPDAETPAQSIARAALAISDEIDRNPERRP